MRGTRGRRSGTGATGEVGASPATQGAPLRAPCGDLRSCPREGSGDPAESSGQARYRGRMVCGTQACPVCGPKIRWRRPQETETALARYLETGGGAVMVALTAPHRRGNDLGEMWDALTAAWRSITTGRHRAGLRERFGHRRTIRATEVTHARHGWHVHQHPVEGAWTIKIRD